jgi:ribosome-associated toxin RatA of RatAB toxin-antitoxin module
MALETIEREHVVGGIPPQAVFAVVTDYASYPRIIPEFTGAKILSRSGPEGSIQRVEFRARVVVEVRYVLEIVHDLAALTTSWTFVEGEVVSDSVGGWRCTAEGDGTRIHYRAGMAIRAPLPKFVINKVSNALMGSSIPNMFKAVEREAQARANYAK